MTTTRVASNRSSSVSLLIAGSCLFVTGFVALVYEICWIRKASLAFGSATWALSAVLAVFFSGLALGSLVAGLYCPRSTRPLRVYAWLEMGVGLLAILSPTLFALTDAVYGMIYPHVVHSALLLMLTRLVVITIVILPATTLMGGSLPLFCRQYVQRRGRISQGVGVLYGLNTVGAAAGSAACGFWMIPHIGVNISLYLAGAANLLVSLIAFGLARGTAVALEPGSDAGALPGGSEPATSQQVPVGVLAWLFFGVGFVALGHEVVWTRYLSLWMPNTVYTYTLTLSVVLLGIVLGSLLAAWITDRLRWRATLFGMAQVASGLSVMMVMQSKPAWWGEWLSPISVGQQLGVITLVMLVPAILSGLSFPLAVRLVVQDACQTGSAVGKMAAINMVGGIAGSVLIGFVALPLLGLQITVFLTTGMSLLIGIVAWWTSQRGPAWPLRASWAVISVLIWAAIPALCRTRLPQDFLATGGTLVDFREGIGANVSVIRKGDVLQLEINRMWQGQNLKNHQVMAAHIPALLHPDPKSVLVIGLGTGQTARSFLVHDINRLDCVEIEDGLIDLVARHFDSAWMADPRVTFIVEDGRNYVTHTSDQYDLISIEVGQIYRPRVASFYTADFYQRIRGRLRPEGLVCQFLPIEFFGPQEFRTMVATFLHVFPHSVLWYNTSELLLVGTVGNKITLNAQRLTTQLAESADLKRELDYAYWGGPSYVLTRPEVFLAGFLCGPEQLEKLSEGGDIYRDDRPYLEYVTLLGSSSVPDTVSQLRHHLSPLSTVVEASHDQWLAAARTIRVQNLQEIVAHMLVNRAQSLEADDQLQDAAFEYQQALRIMPDHPKANVKLAALLQAQGRPRDAIPFYRRALNTRPDDVATRHNLASALAMAGDTTQAQEEFRRMLALQPDDAAANYELGVLLQADGHLTEAEECYQKSLRTDPDQAEAHIGLAGLLVMQQRLDEAIGHFEKALARDPRVADLHVRLGWALAMAGRREEAKARFQEALELQPGLARAHLGMGNVLSSSEQPDLAAQAYQRAAALDPTLMEAHLGLAYLMQSQKRWNAALQHFRQALELAPRDATALRGAAWILATHPDAAVRNPQQAVAWAELAWEVTRQQDPHTADVLAAAYAAAGRFEQAVPLAEQALQLANAPQLDEFAAQIRQRLTLYRQGRPFVQ